ncbi:hypothetical protein ILUMI_17470 [Ignelater luminosus]|uniref:Uncharacterized protein n=1 Tax=Ignelater luminosus TaxID=2038154 RepID=A0A8K0G7W3_IGNLU|nr:hypothetical protein ILUMI_17470 [Ignelater luminosus]
MQFPAHAANRRNFVSGNFYSTRSFLKGSVNLRCFRNENNRMWRCWQGVVWVNGWKKTFVYGSLGTIPLIWPHKLWLAYVAGGQLVALAVFHLLLSFKGRRRRKRKDRLLNGDIDSFERYKTISRFEEVTEVLDDGLPEPIPGSSHSLSDSLAEPDTILEI